ncbi:collagenase, partial [Thalassotalea ganghwensis]
HYLDGRMNFYGDYSYNVKGSDGRYLPTTWWTEGLAQYLYLENHYPAAINVARNKTYTLSTIFQHNANMSDWNGRAYPWGYLGVRFMFEKHRSDIDALLELSRDGDVLAYKHYINETIGDRYDAEFTTWLETVDNNKARLFGFDPNTPVADGTLGEDRYRWDPNVDYRTDACMNNY